jgi:TPR repeat protein
MVESLLAHAVAGDSVAQDKLATCYFEGTGVEQDFSVAFNWWLKAAEQGNSCAQASLGKCYEKGHGVEEDLNKALQWYQKAANQGNVVAQYSLGLCYKLGKGPPKNLDEAIDWLHKAAMQGYAPAQYSLTEALSDPQRKQINSMLGVARDYSQEFKWLKASAEQGYRPAQSMLGTYYELGRGVSRNPITAAEWHHKAAEKGSAISQYLYACFLMDGTHVIENHPEALKWLEKYIRKNKFPSRQLTDAGFRIGVLFENGINTHHDLGVAASMYLRAAKEGHKEAQYSIANLYQIGSGVEISAENSVKWFSKAAAQGDILSIYSLAKCYEIGSGVNQDLSKSRDLIKKVIRKDEINFRLIKDYFPTKYRFLIPTAFVEEMEALGSTSSLIQEIHGRLHNFFVTHGARGMEDIMISNREIERVIGFINMGSEKCIEILPRILRDSNLYILRSQGEAICSSSIDGDDCVVAFTSERKFDNYSEFRGFDKDYKVHSESIKKTFRDLRDETFDFHLNPNGGPFELKIPSDFVKWWSNDIWNKITLDDISRGQL